MAAIELAPAGFATALSHDHYLTIAGGVQNCIGDEQAALCAAGWAYLHICPNRPLPMLAPETEAESFQVLASLNGQTVGVTSIADLEAILADVVRAGHRPRCVVHHMLGFAPELVTKLIQASGEKQPIVWVHDLFTLCPSVHLLRNDASFCFAPPVDSAVCGICNAGQERAYHVQRMRAFFSATHPSIAAPSATLLDFWSKSGKYTHSEATIISPCDVAFDGKLHAYPSGRPLRVAFFGSPTYHKGWEAFESLARWHAKDTRYAFYHFGSAAPELPNLIHIPVTVTRQNRLAMVDAAKAAEVDVVINWSMCYESFSFTATEAIAAGAFVIARRDAGNVWPLVRAVSHDRGVSIATEAELYALFAEGRILDMAANADRRTGTLKFSRYTGALLERERANG